MMDLLNTPRTIAQAGRGFFFIPVHDIRSFSENFWYIFGLWEKLNPIEFPKKFHPIPVVSSAAGAQIGPRILQNEWSTGS